MTYHFGYWVFGRDMLNVNLENLKGNGVTDLFLNYYAFSAHGESAVLAWIAKAKSLGINVHIWMQCFYDGSWHNPKTTDLTSRINEAKKYANMKNVAGVHLDYLRYPGTAYKTTGGADAITNFVKTIRNQNPNTFLSCAVMPEDEVKYYYGQDIDALIKIVDVVIPMQYKGNYNGGSNWLASTTKTFSSKANIWSGLQSYKSDDDTTVLSASELLNDTKTCLNNGAKGVILFRYGLSPNINFTTVTEATVTNNSDNMSKKITNKNVYNLAKNVKDYVEKNKKFPSSIKIDNTEYTNTEIAYVMSYAINNLKSDVAILGIKAPSSFNGGESIKEDIYPSDFKDQAKRIIQYVTQNGQLPLYVTTVKSQKHASVQMFSFAFSKILVWYNNHNNTLPNYCTYDTNVFNASATAVTSTPKSTKTKILNADVYTLARNVKASVEKNKKLEASFKIGDVTYTNTEVAYILSSAINNLKSDITIPSIKAPSTFSGGQAINEDIYPSDFKDQAKRIVNYVTKNGQLPVYVTSVKSQKQISVQMFTYAFSKTLVWYKDHSNTLPNYTNYNTSVFGVSASSSSSTSTSTSTTSSSSKKKYGHATKSGCDNRGQNNGYYCGCHSLQEVFRNLTGIVVKQSTIASWAGTTTSGTDHDGLNTAVAKFNKTYGYNLSVQWKSFSEVGWAGIKKIIASDNQDGIIHLLYRLRWGHYETINKDYSNYCDVQNSLGDKCSSGCYCGYVEERSHSTFQSYINGISQKSVMIITRK